MPAHTPDPINLEEAICDVTNAVRVLTDLLEANKHIDESAKWLAWTALSRAVDLRKEFYGPDTVWPEPDPAVKAMGDIMAKQAESV